MIREKLVGNSRDPLTDHTWQFTASVHSEDLERRDEGMLFIYLKLKSSDKTVSFKTTKSFSNEYLKKIVIK